jgi:serine/threonine protein phosphatase PrpC
MSPASAASERRAGRGESAPAHDATLRCASASHPGLVRKRNEDRVHADPSRGLFMVVDGMGGEASGDQAAEIAVEMVRQRLERGTGSAEERIREAIAVANNEILARAHKNPAWKGMGCVLTVALVEDGAVTVGHVGDSRLYVLRDGEVEKITRDHSPVGEREDRGELDERAAMSHPRRHEVYRAVGPRPHSPFDSDFVDISHLRLRDEDGLLLCSDGLTDLVTSDEIADIVRSRSDDPAQVVERLIAAALAQGGKDNVSVVLALGPRFASPAARFDSGDETLAERRGGTFVRRPWVQFALGGLLGALITAALSLLGASPPIPAPVERPAVGPSPQLLQVGSGQRFATIGDAVAAAHAGDTVLVRPGTYREQVRLKDGVTLMSAVSRAATLVPTAERTAVVAVVAEGIGSGRLSGFAIHGARNAPLDVGIRLRDAAVAIEDVEVRDARLAGVVFEGRVPAALRASWIHDNPGAGILVRAGAASRLAHNRIEKNGGASQAGAGIELEAGARAEITDNLIVSNAAGGIRGLPRRQQKAVLDRNRFESGGKGGPAFAPARAEGQR